MEDDRSITTEPNTPTAPPMVAAAMAGDYDEIYHILSVRPGAVNEGDEDDSTALMCSAVGGYLDIVKLLLDRAADPDRRDLIGGYTALTLATKYSYIDIVRTLVQRGADVAIKDFEGNTARSYAKTEEIKKILGRPDLVRKAYHRELKNAKYNEAKMKEMRQEGNSGPYPEPVSLPAQPAGPKRTKSIFAK